MKSVSLMISKLRRKMIFDGKHLYKDMLIIQITGFKEEQICRLKSQYDE